MRWLDRHRPMLLLALSWVLAGCATSPPPAIEREAPAQGKLATRVKAALAETDGVDAAAIFVDAGSDGRVRLSGFADSADARQLAGQVAAEVAGEGAVDNRIELR